jgi:5-methyltetrahydrofolate--homocysteine methyltransferase
MKFTEWLKNKIIIADGAMGTMLQNFGLSIGACPEEWNISHPEIVKRIHKAYVEAGADILLTNTFGGTRLRLAKFGLDHRASELNHRAVRLAKEAVDDKDIKDIKDILIAASIGPTGEFMQPFGNISFKEAVKTFSEQIQTVTQASADLICVETMIDLTEVKAVIEAARENSNLPIIVMMIFERGVSGYKTIMGIEAPAAIEELIKFGADVVGANCGRGSAQIVEVMKVIKKEKFDVPLIAKPNAGEPRFVEGRIVYIESAEYMSENFQKLADLGVSIIGGCCGTTPAHIKKIAEQLKRQPIANSQ